MKTSLVLLGLFFSSFCFAHNKVVVVPLLGEDLKSLSNVVTVAKENGDFTNPIEALASITDARANNPYLLVIAPGEYEIDEQIVMKQYVDIAGSGKNATVLKGRVGGLSYESGSLLNAANYSSIRDLTLHNTNSGNYPYVGGISSIRTTLFEIDNVSINVFGGPNDQHLYAVYNNNYANLRASHVNVVMSGAARPNNTRTGLLNSNNAKATLSDVSIRIANNNNGTQTGINNSESSSVHTNGLSLALEYGFSQHAISNTISSVMKLQNSDIRIVASGAGTGVLAENRHSNLSIHDSTGLIWGTNQKSIAMNEGSVSTPSRVTILGSEITLRGAEPASRVGLTNINHYASVYIRNTHIFGASNSVSASTGGGIHESYISDSILSGLVTGSPKCDAVYLDSGVSLNDSCK